MLRNIAKVAAVTLVALVAFSTLNASTAEAGGYGGSSYRSGGYHRGGGDYGHRGYGRRGYGRGDYGHRRQYVSRQPCYEKVVIDYKIVREPYYRYVVVVDDYGCEHQVKKVYYREVRVPVKRYVKVCP